MCPELDKLPMRPLQALISRLGFSLLIGIGIAIALGAIFSVPSFAETQQTLVAQQYEEQKPVWQHSVDQNSTEQQPAEEQPLYQQPFDQQLEQQDPSTETTDQQPADENLLQQQAAEQQAAQQRARDQEAAEQRAREQQAQSTPASFADTLMGILLLTIFFLLAIGYIYWRSQCPRCGKAFTSSVIDKSFLGTDMRYSYDSNGRRQVHVKHNYFVKYRCGNCGCDWSREE